MEKLGFGGSRVADQEVAIADVQRQVVAMSLGETMPTNSSVGESQSNGRIYNATQRVQVFLSTLTMIGRPSVVLPLAIHEVRVINAVRCHCSVVYLLSFIVSPLVCAVSSSPSQAMVTPTSE